MDPDSSTLGRHHLDVALGSFPSVLTHYLRGKDMELVNATAQGDIRLADLLNQMVALRYTQPGPAIESTFEGQVVISQPSQAEVYSFDGEAATKHGTTLVFPEIIQNTIKSASGAFVVGWLRKQAQKGDATKTVVLLEPLSDEDLGAFRAAVNR